MSRKARIAIWIVVVIALGVATVAAWFYVTSRGRSVNLGASPDKTLYPVTGVDISAHNGVVDYDALVADSIDFVIIKASEGATFRDRTFVDNIRRARQSGLPVGAYHFFRFDTPGHLQALNFLNAVKGRDIDMPLIIDVEEWTNDRLPTEAVAARLDEMIDYIEQRGYRVMIYTNKDGLERFFSTSRLTNRPLWICSFSNPPLPHDQWLLWQHTHRGSVRGIDGIVDVNTFNGSRDDWKSWIDSVK